MRLEISPIYIDIIFWDSSGHRTSAMPFISLRFLFLLNMQIFLSVF